MDYSLSSEESDSYETETSYQVIVFNKKTKIWQITKLIVNNFLIIQIGIVSEWRYTMSWL